VLRAPWKSLTYHVLSCCYITCSVVVISRALLLLYHVYCCWYITCSVVVISRALSLLYHVYCYCYITCSVVDISRALFLLHHVLSCWYITCSVVDISRALLLIYHVLCCWYMLCCWYITCSVVDISHALLLIYHLLCWCSITWSVVDISRIVLLLTDTGQSCIVYNYLCGENGKCYEGRGGDKVGNMTKGYDKTSLQIAMIGTYTARDVEKKGMAAIDRMMGSYCQTVSFFNLIYSYNCLVFKCNLLLQ